jgi:hypothetical protein
MAKAKQTKKKTEPIEGETVQDPADTQPVDNSTADVEIIEQDEVELIKKNAKELESALVSHPGMELVPGVTTDQLKNALVAQTEQRVLIKQFIQHHLVEGVDFGRIHVVKNCANQYTCTNKYHYGKDMLFKPGQEKIFSLFGITSELVKDTETYEMLPNTTNMVAYKCVAKRGDITVAEGRGAAVVGDNRRDVNATIKIAEKRARMDACLALGFSEYFSQDLDDPDYAGQRQQANERAAAEAAAKHPEEMPEPPKPVQPGDNLAPRPAMELASQEEKAELYKAFLKAGLDKDEQLEVLAVNGITKPAEMTSGMARGMIAKLNDNAFKRPEPKTQDVVIEDISDEPINLDDIPTDFDKPATPPAAPAAAPIVAPPLDVDDELKTWVAEQIVTIRLNARGQMWLKRLVTGKPFGDPHTWTDEQWRRCYDIINQILDCKLEVEDGYMADDTPEQQSEVDKVVAMFPGAEVLPVENSSPRAVPANGGDDDIVTTEPPADATGPVQQTIDDRPPVDGDPRDI